MKYKQIEDNILIAIGESKVIGENQTEITSEEYNNILSVIQNKPDDTETIIYKLNAETLEYEPYDRPEEPTPTEPIIEPTDPVIDSIISEVASNGY